MHAANKKANELWAGVLGQNGGQQKTSQNGYRFESHAHEHSHNQSRICPANCGHDHGAATSYSNEIFAKLEHAAKRGGHGPDCAHCQMESRRADAHGDELFAAVAAKNNALAVPEKVVAEPEPTAREPELTALTARVHEAQTRAIIANETNEVIIDKPRPEPTMVAERSTVTAAATEDREPLAQAARADESILTEQTISTEISVAPVPPDTQPEMVTEFLPPVGQVTPLSGEAMETMGRLSELLPLPAIQAADNAPESVTPILSEVFIEQSSELIKAQELRATGTIEEVPDALASHGLPAILETKGDPVIVAQPREMLSSESELVVQLEAIMGETGEAETLKIAHSLAELVILSRALVHGPDRHAESSGSFHELIRRLSALLHLEQSELMRLLEFDPHRTIPTQRSIDILSSLQQLLHQASRREFMWRPTSVVGNGRAQQWLAVLQRLGSLLVSLYHGNKKSAAFSHGY
jgi:hypothetical protein